MRHFKSKVTLFLKFGKSNNTESIEDENVRYASVNRLRYVQLMFGAVYCVKSSITMNARTCGLSSFRDYKIRAVIKFLHAEKVGARCGNLS